MPAFCRLIPSAKILVLIVWGYLAAPVGGQLVTSIAEEDRLIPAHIAQFELVLGRIRLSREYFRIGTFHDRAAIDNGGERLRVVNVTYTQGQSALQFSDQGGSQTVKLRLSSNGQAEFDFAVKQGDNPYRLMLHQPVEGPIEIKIEDSGTLPLATRSAASLWHLVLDDPQFFRQYVEGPLRKLEPSWDFLRVAEDVRSRIASQVEDSSASMTTDEAISDLDAPESDRRLIAYRFLESQGLEIESHLRAYWTKDLSANQRGSIRRLLRTLQPRGADDSMRIAIWLAHSPKTELHR